MFCSQCIIPTLEPSSSPAARWAAKNLGSSRKMCVKCSMLSAGDYTRNDLSTRFSAKEIRTFLIGRRIIVDNCKEKADLIELAMTISRVPDRSSECERAHQTHVAQLKVNCTGYRSSHCHCLNIIKRT